MYRKNLDSRHAPMALCLTLCLAILIADPVAASGSGVPLDTLAAQYESTVLERVFDGTVEAVHQATVSAQTGGRIAEVYYDVDDYVEAGAIIVRFTDVEQRSELRRTEAQLNEALALQVEAEEGYRRAENLVERSLGSRQDLDRARAARDSATARVAAAESAVDAARQRLEYTVVRAPYPGIVTERHVEVGETVTPGRALMSGLSLERLRIAVDIPQRVAQQVRPAPRAAVLFDDGRIEPLAITIFPVADPVTNTFRVRLDLPDGQYGLYPGMYVKVAFAVGEAERLLIPVTSLVQRSEVTAVYVIGESGVRLRQVRTGARFGDRVEVLAGLREGERIALDTVQAGMLAKSRDTQQP